MNEKDPASNEYLGRFPSESEYIRRINDISEAISRGESGYIQTQNLIYDLPYKWKDEIKKDLDTFALELKTKISTRNLNKSERVFYERQYSLAVKQRIISFLFDVGMWTPTRQKVPEGSFSLFEGEDKEEIDG